MTDERTADEIERDIEQDRAQMSDALNDLQKKFSIDGMINDVRGIFEGQGGELGRTITQTVARNPGAVVLTSVGLAWLLISQARGSSQTTPTGEHGTKSDADRWSQNPAYPYDPSDEDTIWYIAPGSPSDQGTAQPALIDKIRDTAAGAANKVSGAVADGAARVSKAAADLSDQFLHGTEGLSDEAKARVQAARQAAYDAKNAGKAAVKSGADSITGFFDQQPLVLGALAMAFGAALGTALPNTKAEDDAFGATAKSLFDEAQRIFAEEKAKAMSVVQAVTDEAKNTYADTKSELASLLPEGKTAVDAVVDRVTGAASRVVETAKDEAGRQGLGQIKSDTGETP